MKKAFTILFLTLLLIPSISFASTGLPGLPVHPNTDLSIKLLDMILGNDWYSWISGKGGGGGPESALAAMFGVYDKVVLTIIVIIVTYTYGVGIADTAHTGKSFGEKYSTLWTPIRQVGAVAALIPLPGLGGISLGTGIIAWIIMASVGLANAVWDAGVNYMVSNGGGISPISATGYTVPAGVVQGAIKMGVDYAGLTIPVADGGPGLTSSGFSCNINPGNGKNSKVTCGFAPFYNAQGVMIPGNLGTVSANCISNEVDGKMISDCGQISGALSTFVGTVMNDVAQAVYSRGASGSLGSNFTNEIIQAEKAYDQTTASAVTSVLSQIKSSTQTGLNKFKNTTEAAGWASAGMFYYEIGSYNLAYQKATEVTPSYSSGNSSLLALVPNISQSVYTAAAKDVDQAMNAVDRSGLEQAANQYTTQGTATQVGTNKSTGAIARIMHWAEGMSTMVSNALKSAIVGILGTPGSGSSSMNPIDPIVQLQHLGDVLVYTASVLVTSYLVIRVGAAAAGGASQGLSGIPLIGWIAAPLGEAASKAISSGLKTIFVFLAATVFTLLIEGFILAFYLPVAPAIMYGFGVIKWLIQCMEAIIATPIWLGMHAMPTGHGFIGDKAVSGYRIFFATLLTPVFMVFALFVSLTMMSAAIYFMALSFKVAFYSANSGIATIPSVLAELVILGVLAFGVANMMVKLISRLPQQINSFFDLNTTSDGGKEEFVAAGGAVVSGGRTHGSAISGGSNAVKQHRAAKVNAEKEKERAEIEKQRHSEIVNAISGKGGSDDSPGLG